MGSKLLLPVLLLLLASALLSPTGATIGEEIPQQRAMARPAGTIGEEIPSASGKQGEEIPTPSAATTNTGTPTSITTGAAPPNRLPAAAGPAAEGGPLGAFKPEQLGIAAGPAAEVPHFTLDQLRLALGPAAEGGPLGLLGAAKSGGGLGGITPPAVGGSEYDLVGTLFNGNAQAFTAAVLASGTSSAAIAIQGMLDLESGTLPTLREALAGPEPGASAVFRATVGGWQLSVCQNPANSQDATARAVSGGGPLAAAAAAGLARAALSCCSKVAGHLAGAAQSLETGPNFASDLEAALISARAQLAPCAIPAQLAG